MSMSEFWAFTLSGIIVAWVPLAVGFIVQHWRLRVYIDKKTKGQTSDIKRMTDIQTGDIIAITDEQTAQLKPRRRLRRGGQA